ncbi:MAG: hypothetical protein E7328_03030 [Clostridiales bacterium]|nr:hypothetical protein [Clostridiales bacterium]
MKQQTLKSIEALLTLATAAVLLFSVLNDNTATFRSLLPIGAVLAWGVTALKAYSYTRNSKNQSSGKLIGAVAASLVITGLAVYYWFFI